MNRYKDIKIVSQIFISIISFFVIVFLSFTFLNERFRTKDADYNDCFKALPENSMDVIVLGSSHAQYSFLPTLFNQQTGLYSHILGSACQPYEVSFEMLKEAYKTQNPELVIMEIYTATPLSAGCLTDGCYVMAGYQMSGEEKYNTFNYLDEEKALSYRNEFLNNHNNWKDSLDFSELLKKVELNDSDIDTTFGYRWNTAVLPPWNYWHPMVYNNSEEVELDEIDVEMLNNIKQLCDSKGTQLMLYMVPMDSIDIRNQSYRDKVWEWCESNNVLYQDQIRMAPDIGYYMVIHNDGAHSYTNGASITTTLLSGYIKDNFTFNNHKDNEMLNEKYENGNGSTMLATLKTEYDPMKYIKYLDGYKGTILLRYNNNGTKINDKLLPLLKNLGIDQEFENKNLYFALLDNGELIYSTSDEGEFEYEGKLYDFRDWGIKKNMDVINNESNLSLVVFNNDKSDYVVKNIDYSRVWEYGYNWYGE